jgi:uncharacterized protein (DUF58 family)
MTLESSYLVRAALRLYHERLTRRGRYVLWLSLIVGFVGLDTEQALAYILFAIAAGPLFVALAPALRPRPRVQFEVDPPARLTARRAVAVRLKASTMTTRPSGPLVAGWGWGGREVGGLRFEPSERFLDCQPGRPGEAQLEIRAERRGRFVLPPLGVGRTDPLGLLSTARVFEPSKVVLAYPRFFTLDDLDLPVGRRYQPGGIPLASNLGDSTEFVGTRDFREGDPLRRIHWRSSARRGKPVVKEYHEEYFSRVALLLDTYLRRRPRPVEKQSFEAAISVLAAVADHMSRSEEVVDIFAAGPDLYEVSAGRSLGYLDNVLDVLACLEPCHEPPFEVLAPRLNERLGRLTTVIAVVLDWDERREAFLRRIRSMGVAVRTFVVHDGPTRLPFEAMGDLLGPITRLSPSEVESRLQAAEAAAMDAAGTRSGGPPLPRPAALEASP